MFRNQERGHNLYPYSQPREAQSDYDFHLSGLEKYLDKHSIPCTRYDDIKVLRANIAERILEKIIDQDEVNFLLILIDRNGNVRVHNNFGTDVDLMMEVNEFFQIE